MRRVSIALFVLLLALLVAIPTAAQVIHTPARRPAAARPVVAAVAPAPAPVVVVAPNQSLFFPPGTPVFSIFPSSSRPTAASSPTSGADSSRSFGAARRS